MLRVIRCNLQPRFRISSVYKIRKIVSLARVSCPAYHLSTFSCDSFDTGFPVPKLDQQNLPFCCLCLSVIYFTHLNLLSSSNYITVLQRKLTIFFLWPYLFTLSLMSMKSNGVNVCSLTVQLMLCGVGQYSVHYFSC